MGLIGGSIGRSIKKINPDSEVVAVVRKKKYIKKILSRAAADQVCLDPIQGIKGADWIILATPPESFAPVLKKIKPFIHRRQIITDVGSVKGYVMKTYRRILKNDFTYIGSHPIAGSEKSGIEASQDWLFKGTLCIVTPDQNTTKTTLRKTLGFWKKMGSTTMVKTEQEHDRIFAHLSHLPHILSFCLAKTVEKRGELNHLAGEAWRDMTRVANSSPELWTEIIRLNKDNIIRLLNQYKQQLDSIEDMMKQNHFQRLQKYFEKAKKALGHAKK